MKSILIFFPLLISNLSFGADDVIDHRYCGTATIDVALPGVPSSGARCSHSYRVLLDVNELIEGETRDVAVSWRISEEAAVLFPHARLDESAGTIAARVGNDTLQHTLFCRAAQIDDKSGWDCDMYQSPIGEKVISVMFAPIGDDENCEGKISSV